MFATILIALLSLVIFRYLQFAPRVKSIKSSDRGMPVVSNNCSRLDKMYAALIASSNPDSFASIHGIYYDRGWTRAVYQLSKPQVHPTGDFVVDALSGNTVQVFIPRTSLCSLADDPFVLSVYPLTASNSAAFSEHVISQSTVMVDPFPNELEKYSSSGIHINRPNSDDTIYGHRNILYLGPTSGYSLPSAVAKGDNITMLFGKNPQISVSPINGVIEQISAIEFGNQPTFLAKNHGVVTITVAKPALTEIKSQVLFTVNVASSAPTVKAYTLDITRPAKTITVKPGTLIFLHQDTTQGGIKHFWATPKGILEAPTGTVNLPNNDIGLYRAVASGTATLTVTELF